VLNPQTPFLQKPFTIVDLATKIREVLGSRSPPENAPMSRQARHGAVSAVRSGFATPSCS